VTAFIKSVVIAAPIETVFGFHEREDALALLTPPFPPVHIVQKTGGIQPGARVELRVGVFRWIALHTTYEKNRLFVDEQIEGPSLDGFIATSLKIWAVRRALPITSSTSCPAVQSSTQCSRRS
jgi:ligand-binding SRPBCC domain-containing protein